MNWQPMEQFPSISTGPFWPFPVEDLEVLHPHADEGNPNYECIDMEYGGRNDQFFLGTDLLLPSIWSPAYDVAELLTSQDVSESGNLTGPGNQSSESDPATNSPRVFPSTSILQPTSSSSPTNQSLESTACPAASCPLSIYGIEVPQSSPRVARYRCAYPGCTSKKLFSRGCDLRKHFFRHSRHLFCRFEGCSQSEAAVPRSGKKVGFASKKDLRRHESKHNPGIQCDWEGANGERCERIFSRVDNMRDHVKRMH